MTRINISVLLSVLFCVNFVNATSDSDAILQMYKRKLQYRLRMVQDKEKLYVEYKTKPKYDICNQPRDVRSAICRNVIRRLRISEGSEGYSNFYVNYLAFTTGEPCRNVKVWINKGELLANQQVVNCFGSSAILSPESSEEMVYFYRKIVIHPWDRTNLLVFEYNEVKNYYMLVRLHELRWGFLDRWRFVDNISSLLFSTPMPQFWVDVPNLYNILSPKYSKLNEFSENENNILNSRKNEILFKICYVVLKSAKYKRRFNYSYDTYKELQSNELLAVLRGPIRSSDISVSIKGYTCRYSTRNDDTDLSKYYVAAGPGDHSVILLEKMVNFNSRSYYYQIIEFVQYLTKDYLNFYVSGSY